LHETNSLTNYTVSLPMPQAAADHNECDAANKEDYKQSN